MDCVGLVLLAKSTHAALAFALASFSLSRVHCLRLALLRRPPMSATISLSGQSGKHVLILSLTASERLSSKGFRTFQDRPKDWHRLWWFRVLRSAGNYRRRRRRGPA